MKSFLTPSTTMEFNATLEQFLKYQLALEQEQPARLLYPAMAADTYDSFLH
ncbi:MAG: XisH family protein [Fischerella sp.]|nr:XisH family protein [Fischerella sp.]